MPVPPQYPVNAPRDPGSSVPYPARADRPVGEWHNSDGWQQVKWAPGTSPVAYSGAWSTTTFDLRPDLATTTSIDNQAYALNRVAGAQLFVAIKGLSANHLGLNCYITQWASPVLTEELVQVRPDEDYTAYIATGLDSALLTVFPPSSGYPVRFWRLRVRFDWIQAGGALPAPLPPIYISGGMY